MRKIVIGGLLAVVAGFVVLWMLRLGYGYLAQPEGGERAPSGGGVDSGFEHAKHNYASAKVRRSGEGAIDQKYERIADVRARARDFDGEESALRRIAGEHGGVIQLEHAQGLHGRRTLNLAIGVPPEEFDAFVAAVRAIGLATYLTIEKQDRTNEWKELEAKRAVLEASRAALAALASHPGSIAEMVTLQDHILEVHQQIQTLGISLGEFDAVNALCTVKVTLVEAAPTPVALGPTIPLWRRLLVAFEWTLPAYLRLLAIALAGVMIALAGAVAMARLRPLSRTLARAEVTSMPTKGPDPV